MVVAVLRAPGGVGGGGDGSGSGAGANGTQSTGAGGGGGLSSSAILGGSGGSGLVVVRYQIGSVSAAKATGGAISFYNGKTIHVFTNSANFVNTTGSPLTVEYLCVGGGGGGGGAQNHLISLVAVAVLEHIDMLPVLRCHLAVLMLLLVVVVPQA